MSQSSVLIENCNQDLNIWLCWSCS